MAKTKLVLRVPTVGKRVGDEIEVDTAAEADALVANGTARRKSAAKSEKD